MSRHLPRLNPFLVGAMVLWGFNFVAVKLLYREMTPQAVAVVRFAIMWLALLILCRIMGLSAQVPRGDRVRAWFMGFLAMGIYMVLFLQGMRESSAAEGAIILGASPVLTLLIATMVGQEQFRMKSLLGALLALSGVALVVLGSGTHEGGRLAGNLMVLASALVWAISTVFSRPLMSKGQPLTVLTSSMPGAILPLLIYGGKATLETDWSSMSPVGWSMLFYIALGAGTAGFALFYIGVKQVGASGAMFHQYLVPGLAAISAFLVLGTPLHWTQLAGLLIVIAGVSIAVAAGGARKHNDPADAVA